MKYLIGICVAGVYLSAIVSSVHPQENAKQPDIRQVSADLKAALETANAAEHPADSIDYLDSWQKLVELTKKVEAIIQASIQNTDQLATSFKEKAQESAAEPQKAEVYRTKAKELQTQADKLYLMSKDLKESRLKLEKKIEEIKSDPSVKVLLENKRLLQGVNTTVDKASASIPPALQEKE